jgi:6-phosphogluconolactonase
VLLGLGSDGHTASLFPGSPAQAEATASTLAVTADYEDRPANRVTLTPAVFNAARQIIFLVAGAAKAEAATAVLGPAPDLRRWPAARIRPDDGLLVWLLDRPAAGMLRRA